MFQMLSNIWRINFKKLSFLLNCKSCFFQINTLLILNHHFHHSESHKKFSTAQNLVMLLITNLLNISDCH